MLMWLKKREGEIVIGEIRSTRMGGKTDTYILVPGKGNIDPIGLEMSRSGRHGKKIWVLNKEDAERAIIVQLKQSNSGKRDVVVKNAPEEVEQWIKQMWVYKRTHEKQIVQMLDMLFKNWR